MYPYSTQPNQTGAPGFSEVQSIFGTAVIPPRPLPPNPYLNELRETREREKKLLRRRCSWAGWATLAALVLMQIFYTMCYLILPAADNSAGYYFEVTFAYTAGFALPALLLSRALRMPLNAALPMQKTGVLTAVAAVFFGAAACNLANYPANIVAVLLESIGLSGTTPGYAVDASPLAGTDLLLCAVFGGLISGVGSGLTIRYGGAMDGIDVMAVIFAKRLGLSVGTFVMVYNVLLYIVCGFVLHSWILPLYSIVTYAAALKTIDFVVEGVDRSKAATIITARPDEICAALSDRFGSGVTRVAAQGGFSNTELAMIYFVVNRFQIMQVREIVHRLDPAAYISITEVADVFKRDL